MLKLFRNIRRKLLAGGETVRYLKYAIGEIVLVVIGILIALSINNWNTNRQKRYAELKIYENIREQITKDSLDIVGQLWFNALYKSQFEKGIQIIENNDRESIDSLAIFAANLTQYSDFDRRGNIYENTVNSGDIRLIKNDEIIDGLLVLEENLMYMNRMESIHSEAMMTYAVPAIKDLIKFASGEVMQPEELYSYEFQNAFFLFKMISDEKDMVYRSTLNSIAELKILLNKELNPGS